MTLVEIKDKIDARLSALWSAIQAKEAAYYAAHGHYWQGLKTHTVYPADGNDTAPDVGTTAPTDQPDAWPAAITKTALPMALQVDVYDGPSGQGYVVHLHVTVNSKHYCRTAQVGPETSRVQGWHIVPPDEGI
jgi:hypothetical protein